MTGALHIAFTVIALFAQLLLLVQVSSASGASPVTPADTMKTVEMDSIVITGMRMLDGGFSFSKSGDELRSVPTASTDPTRALALLPSSVPVSDIKSMPIIGGDEPDRMLMLLDGVPISLPVRLLGAFSVFNPLVTQSIDVTATGFSASYGNAFPAGINVHTVQKYEAPVLQGAFDLTSSTVAFGTPLARESGEYLTAAFRVSHIRAVSLFLPGSARERLDSFTPQLEDAFVNLNLRPSQAWNLKLQSLATSENGTVSSSEKSFVYMWRKVFVNTRTQATLGKTLMTAGLSWSRDALNLSSEVPIEDVGSLRFSTSGNFNVYRGSLAFEVPIMGSAVLTVGSDVNIVDSRLTFGSSSDWLSRQSPLRQLFANSTLFSEVTIPDILSRVCVTAGIRGSYFGLMDRIGVEPRVEIAADLGNATRWVMRYGRYLNAASNLQVLQGFLSFLATPYQPPRMFVTKSGYPATPEESNTWATSLTMRFPVSGSVEILTGIEGYYKNETNLLQSVRYPAVFTVLDSNSFEPSQRYSGRKYGMGIQMGMFLTRWNLRVNGSFSWQHSFTIDTQTDERYPNGGDIPSSMKLLVSYTPGSLRTAMTFQHYSGAPTTGRYFLKGTSLLGGQFFFPVERELNSSHLPAYNRVDFSLSYGFSFGGWEVEPYAQILNLLNDRNVSQFSYLFSPDMDNNVRAVPEYNTLPMLPFVGVRVEHKW